MVKSCVMKACHNREVDAGTSVRSFRFPMPGDRRKLWEEFTRHHNRDKMFKIGAISRASLCFEHFSPECLTDKGNLKRTAVPTIAPKFTAALALKYGLIPNERSALLDVVNNFEKSIDDYLAATEGTPLPLNPDAMDCGVWVDMPSAQDQSCHSHSPDFTAAEIVRMPVVIDLPMKPVSSPAPSPTKSEETVLNSDAEDLLDRLSDEENTDPRGCPSPQVKSILQEKQGSFDSTVANYPSGSEKGSPLKTPRKRHFSQLTEEDMSSPKRGSRAFEISQATVTSYQKRIKILHQRIRRKNLKIKSLEAMLSHLENKHLLDKDVSALIKV
ncbi:THAP domain-containing protein 1 [Frankliniella fusca]|uniref:THAP domain-containing protein 1 n=1 Tax=Frankliniella fusca TaxID=407009 RepID=A0AAE1LRK5_9NEOP|nr:THAP domain-containing protein 1 [Frankliniella fusca]